MATTTLSHFHILVQDLETTPITAELAIEIQFADRDSRLFFQFGFTFLVASRFWFGKACVFFVVTIKLFHCFGFFNFLHFTEFAFNFYFCHFLRSFGIRFVADFFTDFNCNVIPLSFSFLFSSFVRRCAFVFNDTFA